MNVKDTAELREKNLQFRALTISVYGIILQNSVNEPRSSHFHTEQLFFFLKDISNKTVHKCGS
jgi:hypothetical protein